MQINEILRKLAICNYYIKDHNFGISKNDFYRIKTFFIYNLLKNKEILTNFEINVFKEERSDEKFYSFIIDLGDELIKLHQHQYDIPKDFIKDLIMDHTIFEYSPNDFEYNKHINDYTDDVLLQFAIDIIDFNKKLVPTFNYNIIKNKNTSFSVYQNNKRLFNRSNYDQVMHKLYRMHPVNTCNLIISYNNNIMVNKIGGSSNKKLINGE